MNGQTTLLTPKDVDDAYVLTVPVARLRTYFDGVDINEVIPDWDLMVDQAQGDVLTSGERRWIMIEVTP